MIIRLSLMEKYSSAVSIHVLPIESVHCTTNRSFTLGTVTTNFESCTLSLVRSGPGGLRPRETTGDERRDIDLLTNRILYDI